MHRHSLSVIVVCVLGIAALSCVLAQEAPGKTGNGSQTWEYRAVYLLDIVELSQKPSEQTAAIEKQFNQLGQEGWELSLQLNMVAMFKRPKR